MKSPCCFVIFILLTISLGLHYLTLQKLDTLLSVPAKEVETQNVEKELVTASPSPSATPVKDATLLYKVDNPAACSFTDTSKFVLEADHELTKLQTWYSWGSNEITLDYLVKRGDQTVYEGVLLRKDCDPYQSQWCQAVDEQVNRKFVKGEYSLVADTARICQNSLSGGNGFIFVYGK